MSKIKDMIIVYHGNCIDGSACAWAVTEAYNISQENVTYIPYEHYMQASAEKQIKNAISNGPNAAVFFVDVAPEKDFLDFLMQQTIPSIDIYDHHKSAANALNHYNAPKSSNTKLNIRINENHHSASKHLWKKLMPNKKFQMY